MLSHKVKARAIPMLRLYTRFRIWSASDEGATAVEYGIMVALIAVAIIGAVTALGGGLNGLFTGVSGEVKNALP
jgi:pilus assembly protein Flp/PilA